MAFRAVRFSRLIAKNENANGSMMRSFSSTASNAEQKTKNKWLTPELAPLVGMMGVAICIGVHTAYRNLVHAPNVKITKTNRASISEADRPDDETVSGDKFYRTSFLRKVGHVQDSSRH